MPKSVFAAPLMLAAALAAAPASAQTWNATTGFNTGLWSYMQRPGAACAGSATVLGYAYSSVPGFIGRQGVNTPTIVPLVAKNTNATTTVYSSATIPGGAVWLHPGETGVNAKCAVIRFRAPNAATYRVQGFIKSIDAGANSVNGHILVGNVPVGGTLALSGPMGTSLAFNQLVTVPVGPPATRTIDFALDDGGSYYNDSTQIELSITRCNTNGNGNGNASGAGNGNGNGGGNGNSAC